MPLVRVKIAQLEHWCNYKYEMDAKSENIPVGAFITIQTESMQPSDWCDGKCWLNINDELLDKVREHAKLDKSRGRKYVCEHMLEMD